jgi:hypothetical protein
MRTDFWHQAQHERFSERAYTLWEREGYPEGKAHENQFLRAQGLTAAKLGTGPDIERDAEWCGCNV